MPTTTPFLRRLARRAALALAAAVLLAAPLARAEVRIDITRGTVEPMPIAITTTGTGSPQEADVARKVASVVTADLERSGLFRPLNPAGFVQQIASIDVWPRFPDWKVVNAQALVVAEAKMRADGQVTVNYRLWDVFGEEHLNGGGWTTRPENWRALAHKVADAVYKRLTGEEGYFDSRIVYVSETGPADRRIKRLAIMDQDGENHTFVTDGRHLVLTPRFSPVRQEITYLAYVNNEPRVYLLDLQAGRQEVLGDFTGMTFAPRFSPDGNKVVMSHAEAGNSDIYVMDLRTRRSTRLTDHPAIDTSPSYAPDGNRIVFESDRGGSQQLYIMDANGGNVQRLTFGKGRYGNPVWSPRGDLIAFTRIHEGRFYIGVIRPDGSGERMLTEAFHVEGPTWAPNGRVLMYFKERPTGPGNKARTARLYSIDLTGANEREIVTPLDASDPAWSPLN